MFMLCFLFRVVLVGERGLFPVAQGLIQTIAPKMRRLGWMEINTYGICIIVVKKLVM